MNQTKKGRKFLQEIVALCIKYDLSLGIDSMEMKFVIVEFDENKADWLLDETEDMT